MREWLSWWSATLPRSRPRVRVPSRALVCYVPGGLPGIFLRLQFEIRSFFIAKRQDCSRVGMGESTLKQCIDLYEKNRLQLVCKENHLKDKMQTKIVEVIME